MFHSAKLAVAPGGVPPTITSTARKAHQEKTEAP